MENLFGRMKREFSILETDIRMDVKKAPKIIAVCLMLHNMRVQMNLVAVLPEDDTPPLWQYDAEEEAYDRLNPVFEDTAGGVAKRQKIIDEYFS